MDAGEKYTDNQIEQMEQEIHKDYEKTLIKLLAAMRPFFKRLKSSKENTRQSKTKPSQGLVRRLARIVLTGNENAAETSKKYVWIVAKFNTNYQWKKVPSMGGLDREEYNRVDFKDVLDSVDVMFPYTLDREKDFVWNSRRMKRAITQGLNAGDSIPELSKRLARVLGTNESATVMRARTAATGAQNKSRLDALRYAEKKFGVKYVKIWDNSHDNRVRHSHIVVNGERRGLEERFSNGLLYPGEQGRRWAEIANCRCGLRTESVRK